MNNTKFTKEELTRSIDDFSKQCIEPAIEELSRSIQIVPAIFGREYAMIVLAGTPEKADSSNIQFVKLCREGEKLCAVLYESRVFSFDDAKMCLDDFSYKFIAPYARLRRALIGDKEN